MCHNLNVSLVFIETALAFKDLFPTALFLFVVFYWQNYKKSSSHKKFNQGSNSIGV